MQLTGRQQEITRIVRENGPITGEMIAQRLHVTRSALRGDLAVLLSGEVIAARRRLGYYYLGGGEDPAAAEIRSCTAEDCMSRPILVGAESNAYDAAVLLFTEDIGTLFVGKKDDIQGVVSRKDLLKAAMGRDDLAKVPISMVMTSRSKMIYAEPKEDLVSIAQKMMDYEVDCLPVGTFKMWEMTGNLFLSGVYRKRISPVSFGIGERRQKIINGKTTAGLCRFRFSRRNGGKCG